jgi:hypothetical protein
MKLSVSMVLAGFPFTLAPLAVLPAPVAAARALPTEENSAQCSQISGWNATELAVTLGCNNAFEGEIYIIYPDGSRRTLVAYREFWEFSTGDPVLRADSGDRTGSIALTQSGRYTLVLEGKGLDGSLNIINVSFRKSWELSQGVEPQQPEKPSKPEITQPSPSSAAISWTGGEGSYRVVAWKLTKSGKKKPGTRTTCTATLEALGPTTCTLEGLSPGRWKIRIIRTVDGATAVRTTVYKFSYLPKA